MSAPRVAKALVRLREAAAQAAWVQWSAIFTLASTRREARSIVDPEALLLVSLALRDHEPRLWSAAVVWAQFGARLLSVQRAKNLVALFPLTVRERLGEFARLAMRDGGDGRWRSLLGKGTPPRSVPGRSRAAAPRTEGAAALMLRLRLGPGVGIKPDVLASLIGHARGALPVHLAAAHVARILSSRHQEMGAAPRLRSRRPAGLAFLGAGVCLRGGAGSMGDEHPRRAVRARFGSARSRGSPWAGARCSDSAAAAG